VDVKEASIVTMLREHPGFGNDFVEVKESELDPFADTREEIEPPHMTTEIKYGHAEKSTGNPRPVKMTPQMKKAVEKEAIKMIPNILKNNPEIHKDIIVKMAEGMKAKEAAQPEAPVEEKKEEQTQ
jgi:hypothetical protein